MNSIEVKNLVKDYGKLRALNDISFDAGKGELFGLIGPDGAGKTSLFRILVSLLLPSAGEVRIFGTDVVKDYRKIRTMVGYMPGRFSLYQDLSVEENLNFYARVFGTTVAENYGFIRDIYSHIEPFRKRRAGDLSGGMKQKLALSCALIHRPDLLVLDEPTTGVDAVSRTEFWDLLHKFRNEGISIIVSTPYMDEALRCDRVGLIQRGHLLTVSEPLEIKNLFPHRLFSVTSPSSNFTLLNDIRQHPDCLNAWLSGRSIHASIPKTSDSEAFIQLLKSLDPESQCVEIEPGIEDTFVGLMEEQT